MLLSPGGPPHVLGGKGSCLPVWHQVVCVTAQGVSNPAAEGTVPLAEPISSLSFAGSGSALTVCKEWVHWGRKNTCKVSCVAFFLLFFL